MLQKLNIETKRLDHLGLVAQMADDIALVDTLDELAGIDKREFLSFGQATLAMAINALGFTSKPLYMTPDFFRLRDLKFLLGKNKSYDSTPILPEHLNEDKLGRTLDKIAAIGPDRVFLHIAIQAFRKENVKVPQLHLDTTTHSFYGNYENEKGEPRIGLLNTQNNNKNHPQEIIITHGFSKDHKNLCKQMVQELLVSSDGDVPLMFKAHSGNANDSIIMKERMNELKRCLMETQAEDLLPEIIVADSKLFCEASIQIAKQEGTRWITRVPETVRETKECIQKALAQPDAWISIDDEKFVFQEFMVEKYNDSMRFFAIRSIDSQKRSEKTVIRRVSKEKTELESSLKALSQKRFACEEDLKLAYEGCFQKTKYHKRSNGIFIWIDPSTASKKSTQTNGWKLETWSYTANEEAIHADKEIGACFVLGSNVKSNHKSAEEIIKIYCKEQQGVERSFRFVKDNRYFTDAFFLKKPSRVSALLCVMTISLLLYSLLQRRLRLNLKAHKETLPNQLGKKTSKPTLRMVNERFEGVDVAIAKTGELISYHFQRMSEFVKKVLWILGENYIQRYTQAFIS